MFGEKKQLADNLIFLEGREPRTGLTEGDVASSLIYKKNDTVYVIDTGCGKQFRRFLKDAIETLRPFSGLCVLNTHSHPDHTANNGILGEIDCTRKRHFISARGIEGLDYVTSFTRVTGALDPWCTIFEVIAFPWSILLAPWILWSRIHPRAHRHFIAGTISKFKPLDPSPGTAEPLESLPLATSPVGSGYPEQYLVDDAIIAIPTRGHSPDHVSFYIPEYRALFTADETFTIFPLWPDSDSEATGKALGFFRALASDGAVDIVADSHSNGVRGSAAAEELFVKRQDAHRAFVDEFDRALEQEEGDPDVHRIYRSMVSRQKSATVAASRNRIDGHLACEYFEMEFPRMPVYLKVVLTTLLHERFSRGTML